MKITDDVYLVGSGRHGFSMTDDFDCHVYLIDGGDELAMVDTGARMGLDRIFEIVRAEGFEPERITQLLITHTHADHAGGAARVRDRVGARVVCPAGEAKFLESGDEQAISLDRARDNGFYPADYHMEPCPVDQAVEHDDVLTVGPHAIRTLIVPGHSQAPACYLMETERATYLFSGDVVFCDGRIGLLNCAGSSLEAYREHIGRLAGLGVDVLLPGHTSLVLAHGQAHIDKAIDALNGLAPPPNFL